MRTSAPLAHSKKPPARLTQVAFPLPSRPGLKPSGSVYKGLSACQIQPQRGFVDRARGLSGAPGGRHLKSQGLFCERALWMRLQDKRQVDVMAEFAWESPGDTETIGRPLRVVIERNVIVAVLDGQDVGSTIGFDVAGEKINRADISLLIIRDRGALPPPFRFVVAPHLQDGLCHPHARFRRGEGESAPKQVSRPAPSFLVAALIAQANGSAIAGQGDPRGSGPERPPNLRARLP